MPVKAVNYASGAGGISADTSYHILMDKCVWGNLNEPGVYVDRESYRNSIIPKQNFMWVADGLLNEGKNEEAVKLLDTCLKIFPDSKICYDMFTIPLVRIYYKADANEQGNALAERIFDIYDQDVWYYDSQRDWVRGYFYEDREEAVEVLANLWEIAQRNDQKETSARFAHRVLELYDEKLMIYMVPPANPDRDYLMALYTDMDVVDRIRESAGNFEQKDLETKADSIYSKWSKSFKDLYPGLLE